MNGFNLMEVEGTGLDRFRAWNKSTGRRTDAEMGDLEAKWRVLSQRTSHRLALFAKILDIRFGITGKPHTVRDTANLVGLPTGTIAGKILDAAASLVNTPVEVSPPLRPLTPGIKEIPYLMPDTPVNFTQTFTKKTSGKKPQPVPVSELPDDGTPVTFQQVFGRRKSPMAGWLDLPAGDRQWILFAMLKMREEQDQAAQMAKRHGMPEVAAECWSLADALRVAMRVLESGE